MSSPSVRPSVTSMSRSLKSFVILLIAALHPTTNTHVSPHNQRPRFRTAKYLPDLINNLNTNIKLGFNKVLSSKSTITCTLFGLLPGSSNVPGKAILKSCPSKPNLPENLLYFQPHRLFQPCGFRTIYWPQSQDRMYPVSTPESGAAIWLSSMNTSSITPSAGDRSLLFHCFHMVSFRITACSSWEAYAFNVGRSSFSGSSSGRFASFRVSSADLRHPLR